MRNWRAKSAAIAAVSALALITACSSDNEDGGNGGNGGTDGPSLSGTLNGAGSSAQEAAQQAFREGFREQNPDVTINYDATGSGGGREQFAAGAVDYAGTDAYLDDEEGELSRSVENCGELVELPLYVSPIAVAFNLEGIDSLNLSPSTIARIFNQQITNWNDEAIAADNPDVELPDLAITPVNRSDESGTTENFVEYLAATAPEDWPHEVSGDWPVSGGEAAAQTSGVVDAIGAGEGTIGYLDASRAADFGTVAVGVGEEFVEYSPEAAAAVLEVSERVEGRGEFDFAYDLARDTTEAGTYPIVLVSYNLACTTYDDAETAERVRAYFDYMLSEEGQAAAAESAGSAPLSDTLRELFQPAVDAIGAAG
ncbi:phosphate ABC transporter substrate-binding protein PstS [Streptomyces sp. DSM 44917]|uniref:Phosphate-binding protein n=1 Tax=Streptomyces boetiae TaxID=3075541 RepID=A0ABU2L1R3_9ACTN|nr:phosphate ABC transporter substrate-binding protein PstS [Streptomyces sp. DSM 44917]MDT0305442.1 phosphate ABC transporter substrate-binding protein PstS [Streptomyces sp. DSM 44917]